MLISNYYIIYFIIKLLIIIVSKMMMFLQILLQIDYRCQLERLIVEDYLDSEVIITVWMRPNYCSLLYNWRRASQEEVNNRLYQSKNRGQIRFPFTSPS